MLSEKCHLHKSSLIFAPPPPFEDDTFHWFPLYPSLCCFLGEKKEKKKTILEGKYVNGAGAVCDRNTSKFFVSSAEGSMAGHMGVKAVY